jgi:transcriptional regulator with XRE-family HTH domain
MKKELTAAEHVGKNVHDLRRAAGLSQGDLAAAMSAIGLAWHRGLVADVETGARELTVSELVALAAYFELPITSIVVSPATLAIRTGVRVGDRSLEFGQWKALWFQGRPDHEPRTDHTAPAGPWTRKAIDKLVGGLYRPWAKIWRKQGGGAGAAYLQAWEKVIASRPLPGPTFVATIDEGVDQGLGQRPWSQNRRVTLNPGVPFVARDEVDRELLERLEQEGAVRRITPQQAFKLRRRDM